MIRKNWRITEKERIKKRIENRDKPFMSLKSKRNFSVPTIIPPAPMVTRSTTKLISKMVNENNNIPLPVLDQYVKKGIVDYDAVIIIASFNRFKKINRLLKQLHEQKTKYKIKIIVYNDGSTDINYGKLQKKFPEIDYIKNKVNNGKHKYWETITTLFKKASEYISHVVIQIDDDFFLCDNFIDKVVDKFFEAKAIDNKNVAIHYHISKNATNIAWGMSNWVDGGTLFDTDFLKKIEYQINSISVNRWNLDSEVSSGVWRQVSQKIHNSGLLTYKLEYSLAEHNGNDNSKMNTKLRKTIPIYTKDFKKD